ncbi:hopanoid biosynthesis associated radical SAM protein HpnH [Hypericibacter terrae]|uniref:Hopanoid biosynthesis associated radical SAM protein HpnH n=1 Tax=Hypericibacter terrae TaxID=2602015 RepID=A0A5J6MCN0_9PROT|nr:adenosyl-hopene transferase HpnH [Hypericibacter terrae]QEX15139.1 hopanoid biosynthesis associated radical SAM protein HpnH [Hypericibacter terrae]
MSVPLIQKIHVGAYLMKQRLQGKQRYPLVLMLEPLFRCNLACAGCGKIDYPDDILNRRLSVEECVGAAEECGAPIVSIAGGEPLLHKEMPKIVAELVKRRRFIYLCTNALLLEKKIDQFKPSPYLCFSIHLDGDRERHDKVVCQDGVYDKATAAIKAARAKGFRVNVNCTLFDGEQPEHVAHFLDSAMEMGVSGVTISPGYAYERAPDQQHFLKRSQTKQLFRDVFRYGKGKGWRLNQSALFLDFLAGNQTYHCTPWGNPTRNVFGWQKPCYLLGEGHVATFRELMDDTNWDLYGTGNYEKCADCMVHCGYEATAVNDTLSHPVKAMMAAMRGPKTDGPMAPEIALDKARPAEFVFERQLRHNMDKLTAEKDASAKTSSECRSSAA